MYLHTQVKKEKTWRLKRCLGLQLHTWCMNDAWAVREIYADVCQMTKKHDWNVLDVCKLPTEGILARIQLKHGIINTQVQVNKEVRKPLQTSLQRRISLISNFCGAATHLSFCLGAQYAVNFCSKAAAHFSVTSSRNLPEKHIRVQVVMNRS